MYRSLILSLLSMVALAGACAQRNCPSSLPDNYEAQIETWQAKERASLSDPDGWLSLIGLYWLAAGENHCGSGEDMEIPLPDGLPEWAATYTLAAGQVSCVRNPEAKVQMLDSAQCRMQVGSVSWEVIERGGRYAIRMRDTLRPARIRLRPRAYYPIQPAYRVCAQVLPLTGQDSIRLRNIVNIEYALPLAGKLRFELAGETHELLALDGGPYHFFLAISDETTGEMTYGGGRYLACPRADARGETVLDFNQLYNPPCVFTDYATCLLPPEENHIPLALEVGEKTYADH
jgi:uncharacterized protein (DUF1684 family)